MFIESIEMFGVSPKGLLKTSARDKVLVRDAVQRGITSGTVKPLRARIADSVEDAEV